MPYITVSKEEHMKADKQSLIDGVELAIDWGLPVSEEDMRTYMKVVYQRGRADARREAVKNDIRQRSKKLDKLKVRAVGIAFLLILIFVSLVTKDATLLIAFAPIILFVIIKGE